MSVVYPVDVHELWFISLSYIVVVQHCVMGVNVERFIILVGEAVADSFFQCNFQSFFFFEVVCKFHCWNVNCAICHLQDDVV